MACPNEKNPFQQILQETQGKKKEKNAKNITKAQKQTKRKSKFKKKQKFLFENRKRKETNNQTARKRFFLAKNRAAVEVKNVRHVLPLVYLAKPAFSIDPLETNVFKRTALHMTIACCAPNRSVQTREQLRYLTPHCASLRTSRFTLVHTTNLSVLLQAQGCPNRELR